MNRKFDYMSLLWTLVLALGLGTGLFFAETAERARRVDAGRGKPSPIWQAAPQVSVLDEVTTRRRFAGPTDLIERMVDAPEPGDVVRISDRVGRQGGDVILERKVVRQVKRPVVLLRSSLDASFDHQREGFQLAFGGVYEWENPNDAPALMRFAFRPPTDRRSISGFRMSVGGREIENLDPKSGAYVWSGKVPARTRVTASVRYRTQGAEGFRYEPGSGRIGAFELRVRGDRTPTVPGESLPPNRVNGDSATWVLGNVLPGAAVEFGFPSGVPGKEGQERALQFAPIALAAFAVGAWLVRSTRAPAATVAFAAGLAGMTILASYMTPIGSVVLGATVAGVAGAAALATRRGAFAGFAGALLSLTPMLPQHFPLLLWGLGLLVLGPTVIRRPREVPLPRRAYVS